MQPPRCLPRPRLGRPGKLPSKRFCHYQQRCSTEQHDRTFWLGDRAGPASIGASSRVTGPIAIAGSIADIAVAEGLEGLMAIVRGPVPWRVTQIAAGFITA